MHVCTMCVMCNMQNIKNAPLSSVFFCWIHLAQRFYGEVTATTQ